MDLKSITKTLEPLLSPLEKKIIPFLKYTSVAEIIKHSKLQFVEVMRALVLLENKKVLVITSTKEEIIKLGKNGIKYLKNKLPERQVLETIRKEELSYNKIKEITKLSDEELKASIGVLKSKATIELRKDKGLIIKITNPGLTLLYKKTPEEELLEKISKNKLLKKDLKDIELFAYNNLNKRKELIKLEEEKHSTIDVKLKDIHKIKLNQNRLEQLTPEMIKKQSWKGKKFRKYDIQTKAPEIRKGARHPYSEAINLIRKVFLDMGFQEMKGPWVDTAFWGMDSMWIAQDHPMREVQDTFYLNKKGTLPEPKLIKEIKAVQENGGKTGSKGHGGIWNPEIAAELILRQHSTATTYRKFGIDKIKDDCKYFEIARVFRNETTDATHLSEFDQAEGFIMGDNLTLADLMGFIKEFYKKLGITKIKFKPTFNPYTEPSMEAHYYDEKMGGWFALINSGIFRPESLAPYGIKKRVIAWGMGVTRMAAILNKKKNIKSLLGPEVDLEWIQNHKRIKW